MLASIQDGSLSNASIMKNKVVPNVETWFRQNIDLLSNER